MRVLDLFSGIGGFSLGLERAGMTTVAFCEIDPYCRAVLRKHWPDVPCYDDVQTLTAERLAADGIGVDLICGGFPCQDISFAGLGEGLEGARSGLWFEYARLIGELRPDYVVVENVAALLSRGLAEVLGTLAALGYDAEWHCIPASALGAYHRRDRVWIVAYPNGQPVRMQRSGSSGTTGRNGRTAREQRVRVDPAAGGSSSDVADTASERRAETRGLRGQSAQRLTGGCEVLPDPESIRRRQGRKRRASASGQVRAATREDVPYSAGAGLPHGRQAGASQSARQTIGAFAFSELERRRRTGWPAEPSLGRMADGIPNWVDRIAALGNAVVPQIPEIIGRAILAAETA